MRLRAGLLTLIIVVSVAAAGCARAPAANGRNGQAGLPAARAQPAAAPASPGQLRAQFDQLLGLHTLLVVRLMRSVVSAAPDFRQAAAASLQENTDTLTKLVASAYGGAQGGRFKQLWQAHITDLFSYANGAASHDQSAQRAARTDLLAYCNAYGAWFAGASKGTVRAGDAAAGVRMHVEDLMRQLDAYAARDYDQAYRLEREAFEHMFTAGATMAKASVTPEVAVGFDTPPERLRSAFAMLLGEHLELIIDAQRATFAGSPQFKAAAAQVNANTTALTQAMAAVAGPQQAARFQSAWADHVDGLMAYTSAVAGKDEAGKAAAERKLNAFASTLAAFFAGVVRNQLDVTTLTGAITMHDRHLIDQVNAYAARNYDQAQRMELDGYQQMLGVANTLVDAIQHTVGPQLPVGGSKTGGGGTAQR